MQPSDDFKDTISINDNIQKYYQLYKKKKTAYEIAIQRAMVAKEKFEYFESKQSAVFENVPDGGETVNVKVIYESGKESNYKVPKGVYIGFDGKENMTYYADESFENTFDFENSPALENVKIYAKNN